MGHRLGTAEQNSPCHTANIVTQSPKRAFLEYYQSHELRNPRSDIRIVAWRGLSGDSDQKCHIAFGERMLVQVKITSPDDNDRCGLLERSRATVGISRHSHFEPAAEACSVNKVGIILSSSRNEEPSSRAIGRLCASSRVSRLSPAIETRRRSHYKSFKSCGSAIRICGSNCRSRRRNRSRTRPRCAQGDPR